MKFSLSLLFSLIYCFSTLAQDSHLIKSKALQEERLINVKLPEGYSSSESYGVLYVLDAEYAFDYAVGAVSFLSNAFGHMPQLIVVGIPNVDRLRDVYVTHDPNDSYSNFLQFIEAELKPFIDKNYQTNGFDILYGWSSAADINFQFLAQKPNFFDAHIQSGTGVGPNTSAFLSEKLPKHDYANRYLYVGTEGSGPRAVGLKKYESLMGNLVPKNLRWKMELLQTASHVDVLGESIYKGLKFIFNDFYIPDSVVVQGVEAIKTYYSQVDKKYDFDIKIPVGAFGESAGILFQNNPDEAVALLKHGISVHPTSADLHGALGEIFEYMGEKTKAAKYYQMAYEKSIPKSAMAMKYKYLTDKLNYDK